MQMVTQSLHKYIVKFLKIDFLKTNGIAKYDIKVSVILANKYEVKAKNFIIPISDYTSTISIFILVSFFFEAFFTVSKEQKTMNEI